jgi:hypothetical protein
MGRPDFEKLQVYRLNEQVQKIKPIIDELSPKLSAYLNSLIKQKQQ